jgi:hypothetical protein
VPRWAICSSSGHTYAPSLVPLLLVGHTPFF